MKRGRPLGHRLSQETKDKIAESKKGYVTKEKTKKKISDGVKRKHHTISIERIMATDLKTATKVEQNGYVSVYIPHLDGKKVGDWIRLHVAIIEQKLGRKLERGEEVHHWGEKDNNNPITLSLASNRKRHMKMDRAKLNLHKYLDKQRKLFDK